MWKTYKQDKSICRQYAYDLGVSPTVVKLLLNRGITTRDAMQSFLAPRFEPLPSQFAPSVEFVVNAIKARKRILLHGDYDADGVTAVAIMHKAISSVSRGGGLAYFVPHRRKDGYGLTGSGIEKALQFAADIVITLDCGVKSKKEVEALRRKGIDVVILDHHRMEENIADTPYIVSGQLLDAESYHHHMCGAGLAFLFAVEIGRKFGMSEAEMIDMVSDIAAIGTIGDMVPLVGINRWIAAEGVRKIRQSPNMGLKAIAEGTEMKIASISSQNVSYSIVPIINAPGRLADASDSVELLLQTSPADTERIARKIIAFNEDRRTEQRTAFEQARKELADRTTEVIVIAGSSYGQGVAGLVAGDLVEEFGRPAVVLGGGWNDIYVGSARSIPGFDIYSAISQCSHHLLSFGGHTMAAGLKLHANQLDDFLYDFNEIFERQLKEGIVAPEPEVLFDGELLLGDITPRFIRDLEMLEPYGSGNMRPLFFIKGCAINKATKIGKEEGNHVRAELSLEFFAVKAVGWGMLDRVTAATQSSGEHDLLCHLSINEWNNTISPQVEMKAVAPSGRERIIEADFPLQTEILPEKEVFTASEPRGSFLPSGNAADTGDSDNNVQIRLF